MSLMGIFSGAGLPRRGLRSTAKQGTRTSPAGKSVRIIRIFSRQSQALPAKNIILPFFGSIWLSPPCPASFRRGVSQSSRTLGAGCDLREGVSSALCRADEGIFHVRRNRVVPIPRRWHQVSRTVTCEAKVATKPGHRLFDSHISKTDSSSMG